MGIAEILTAPHSPWQMSFAERLIGSIRRECLDHVLVLSKRPLRRILTRYFAYYHRARTHLSLDKDAPDVRPIERPEVGCMVQNPEVGGLASSLRPASGVAHNSLGRLGGRRCRVGAGIPLDGRRRAGGVVPLQTLRLSSPA
jgi:Integrase core domain